ncbi:DNA polymerase/3'-5' exonuclease PolX [Roseimaritima ulvae]|uniref:DNA-directed DNA polymerase n=1 Tax=Roseimaritima ulvae TaxID=980254 RepID=A0A5B9QUL2_9BACT|nr:DNA polymerase/3'-5' exonuclease PolX [Roseimaritima ulvae]QEG41095.1 DNA polymerase/3'-5' exonuclease PolX [Roseimaritima ulvae]
MNNAQIANVFDELADLLEFKGENPFRVRAYRNGSKAIRELEESVAAIIADENRKLADVPGIGKTLAEKSETLLASGSLSQLEDLRAEIPASVLQMVRVPGLGAKKAAALHRELGIDTLAQLRDACERQQVRKLKGFAAKTEQMILQGLEIAEAANERLRWVEADQIVQQLLAHMNRHQGIQRVQPAGSYRRGRETVGDVDLLVVADDRAAVMDHFEAFAGRSETIARGDTKVSMRIGASFQVDMRVVESHQFGAALQYFTGSKEHNVHLRSLAKKRGLKINEYGVFADDEETPLASETEADVYAALELPCFPPEIREDRFEFEWAAAGSLPELITLDQIQGDLHMHTTATDGQATIREMADAAIERGLKYIAITDHSKRVAMAGGLDAERLREQWAMIDEIRPEYEGRLEILKGIECDILEDGSMDLDDEVLSEGDWIIASVHYGQKQPRQQITDRITGALANPYVSIVAHPTGRLINRRPPYDVDMEAVVQAAAEHGKLLELNANPARLDLNEQHLTMAARQGVPIVISTDAHSIDGLDVMKHGIQQARRGGLTAAQVANTKPWQSVDPRR